MALTPPPIHQSHVENRHPPFLQEDLLPGGMHWNNFSGVWHLAPQPPIPSEGCCPLVPGGGSNAPDGRFAGLAGFVG